MTIDFSLCYKLVGKKVVRCKTLYDLIEAERHRNVKTTRVSGRMVSTVFLMRDCNLFFNGPSIFFETMVFPERELCGRYSTYDEAVAGHDAIVDMTRLVRRSETGNGKDTKMAVLIIDEKAREEIRKLIKYAEEHPSTMEDLFKIKRGQQSPVGDDPRFVVILSGHYRVVYSREEQPDGNTYHHLSVSVPGRASDKMPDPAAVELIVDEFGIAKALHDCVIWFENYAVNVLKRI